VITAVAFNKFFAQTPASKLSLQSSRESRGEEHIIEGKYKKAIFLRLPELNQQKQLLCCLSI
jgi:hypothetical protein